MQQNQMDMLDDKVCRMQCHDMYSHISDKKQNLSLYNSRYTWGEEKITRRYAHLFVHVGNYPIISSNIDKTVSSAVNFSDVQYSHLLCFSICIYKKCIRKSSMQKFMHCAQNVK